MNSVDQHYSWLIDKIRHPRHSVVLYGSYARGDSTDASDIDVLQIDDARPGRYSDGRLSAVLYTRDQLLEMSRAGALYILHVKTEGVILRDDEGYVRQVLDAYVEPSSYAGVISKVRDTSAALDIEWYEFNRHPQAANRVALHLLRTVLYASCAEIGKPTFAISRVASLLGDTEIAECYAASKGDARSWSLFLACKALLERYLGPLPSNQYGDLESLAVGLWTRNPAGAALVVSILGDEHEIDYAAMQVPAFV